MGQCWTNYLHWGETTTFIVRTYKTENDFVPEVVVSVAGRRVCWLCAIVSMRDTRYSTGERRNQKIQGKKREIECIRTALNGTGYLTARGGAIWNC
jgi:hypothetical protein